MRKFSIKDVLNLSEKVYASVEVEYVHKFINRPAYKRRMWVEIEEEIKENPKILDHYRLARFMVEKDLWPMCGLEKEKDNLKLYELLTFS